LSYLSLKNAENHIFIRLDKTPERDERTDGQPDGPTDRISLAITAVGIASNADAL